MNAPMSPLACPRPTTSNQTITLAHGEGGKMMRNLIRDRIVSKLGETNVQRFSDAACVGTIKGNVAISTDSYVVSPLFFPGGDIGTLAVHGTINDLAMAGASPLFLTLSLILEEGLPFEVFDRVIDSIAETANTCGVPIVAGDTKVVTKGAADGMFLNTTGVGVHHDDQRMSAKQIQPGDTLVVSGPIARHGIAVLAARESLEFMPPPASDSAALHRVAADLQSALGNDLRTMRDATRGGIAAVLHEWAEESTLAMWVDEAQLPLLPETRGVCELLGLDPMFVANEGTFVAAIASHRIEDAISVMKTHSSCGGPAPIGYARRREISPVLVSRGMGGDQPLDEPIAAMLPRIC